MDCDYSYFWTCGRRDVSDCSFVLGIRNVPAEQHPPHAILVGILLIVSMLWTFLRIVEIEFKNGRFIYAGKIYLTMVQIDTTKVSSKGQIVIPASMRDEFKEGDTLLIIRENNTLLLKKADSLDEQFKEDLEFAKRTEEAYKRHEKGEFQRLSADKFLEELEKW